MNRFPVLKHNMKDIQYRHLLVPVTNINKIEI